MRLKKSLGQHFLKDKNIINKIVDAVEISAEDVIVEIGPGAGALTGEILNRSPSKLYLIEIDKDMVSLLKEKFGDSVVIFNEDAKKFDFSKLCEKKIKVVGNLPYNVSTAIIRNLVDYIDLVDLAVFMTQKEVADRLISRKGKEYGYLPAFLGNFFSIKKLFDVSPKVFLPPPKVWSTVFKMVPKSLRLDKEELLRFENFLKRAFSNRRKKLKNNVSNYPEDLKELFERRPEEITPEEFLEIFKKL